MDQQHDIQCTEKKLKDECRSRKSTVMLDWTSPFILSFGKRKSFVDKEKSNTPYVAYSLQSYIEKAVMYLVGPPPKSLCYENFCDIFPLELEPAERRSLGEDRVKYIMEQAFQKALSSKRKVPKQNWISDLKIKERMEKEREIANRKQGTLHSDDASSNNIADQRVKDKNLSEVSSIQSTSSDQVQEVDLSFQQSQTLNPTSKPQLEDYQNKTKLMKENSTLEERDSDIVDSSNTICGENAALRNKFLDIPVERNYREENQVEDATNPSLEPLIFVNQVDAARNLLSESENVIKPFENNQVVLEIFESCRHILSSASTTEPIKPLDESATNLYAISGSDKTASAESFDLGMLNNCSMNLVFYPPTDFHTIPTGPSQSFIIEADEHFRQKKIEVPIENENKDESQAEVPVHSASKEIELKQAVLNRLCESKNEEKQLDNNLTMPIIDLVSTPISSISMESLETPEYNFDAISDSDESDSDLLETPEYNFDAISDSDESDSDLYSCTINRNFSSANDCHGIPANSQSSIGPSSAVPIQTDEQFNPNELEVPFESFLPVSNESTEPITKTEASLDADSTKSTSDESCDGAIEFKEFPIKRSLFSSPNSFHCTSTQSPPSTRPQYFPIEVDDEIEPMVVKQTTSDVLEIHNCYRYFAGWNLKKIKLTELRQSSKDPSAFPSVITLD